MGEPKKNGAKLTDAERHKRFVEVATEVEASKSLGDFDRAFAKVVPPNKAPEETKRPS